MMQLEEANKQAADNGTRAHEEGGPHVSRVVRHIGFTLIGLCSLALLIYFVPLYFAQLMGNTPAAPAFDWERSSKDGTLLLAVLVSFVLIGITAEIYKKWKRK